MATQTSFKKNTILWTDLSTSDIGGAKKFYADLFDWGMNDVPTDGPDYTLLDIEGKSVGAMCAMLPEQIQQGVPSHWNVYIYVENLESTLEAIKQHGGAVVFGPFEVAPHGRMAVARDPQGAHFNVWQPLEHLGASAGGAVGSVCWNDLMTSDVQAALQFYSAVFGWSHSAMGEGERTYYILNAGEHTVGGMMQAPGEMPSVWSVYFYVTDMDKFRARSQELGGKELIPEQPVPGMGSFSLHQDPQGALFYFWKSA